MPPTVSVIMPVYNGETYLRQAIDSILEQTFADFELIIIDDGSTDRSWKILLGCDDPRIVRLRSSSNEGIVTALNKGIDQACGEFIARQDADDLSHPSRFARQVRYLKRHQSVVLLGSSLRLIDGDGKVVGMAAYPQFDGHIRWQMHFHSPFVHTSVMVRRDVFDAHHLRYQHASAHAEDYDLWLRVLNYGQGHNLICPLVDYRIHNAQINSIFTSEQNASANSISQQVLASAGVIASLEDVQNWRQWYNGLPRTPEIKSVTYFFEQVGRLGHTGIPVSMRLRMLTLSIHIAKTNGLRSWLACIEGLVKDIPVLELIKGIAFLGFIRTANRRSRLCRRLSDLTMSK